ncbi:MAG: hypothetical protein LBR44_00440 [Clostridiales Family XIII bacterium]|jgi:signal transduction histidine kinase|nr:hypothetical protein [Clostridiales Family XIII bacterium]
MLKKLRNKLLLVNLVALTIVITAAFSVIYLTTYTRVQADIDGRLRAIPPGVMENLLLSEREAAVGSGERPAGGQDSVVVDMNGRQFVISGEPSIPVDYAKSFVANIYEDGQVAVFSRLNMEQSEYEDALLATTVKGEGTGEVRLSGRVWKYSITSGSGRGPETYDQSIVFLDVDEQTQELRSLAVSLFVIGACAIAAVFFVGFLLANRAIAPVEQGIARQRRFVADASHELKTPLAVIAMNAEAARCSDEPGEWIGNIEAETGRMGRLIESLMNLARSEDAKIERKGFDLVRAAEEEAERVETVLFEKGIAFEVDKPSGQIGIHSDRAELMQALSVLLDNAVKYTSPGGRVTVRIAKADDGKQAFVSVSNTGDFIAPPDMAHIFERFYRADKSRNSGTGGHGIGLSIAKTIMDRLGGGIEAASDPTPDGRAVNTFKLYVPVL